MSEDISKIISKYKLYMSFNGNEYQMIEKVELNKTFEEIERLNNIINKATEYIKDKYAVILADDLFLDHDERIERKRLLEIIDILKGSEKE